MRAKTFFGAFTTGLLTAAMISPANSQITSDNTTNTIVNVNESGNHLRILQGVANENNLFHSFSNFSVPTGGTATFDLVNTPNITTIFSRVTGGNVSNIDGLIQTLNGNNPVSLFLMNPNGIVFGPNAKLDIGGSFVGTTANSIKFADGGEFSAVNPGSPPLLKMSVPIGLQMGQNPGAITNQSATLQVPSGHTLALVGGDITQTGGELRVDGGRGRIELASLGENSQVGINSVAGGWSFDTRDVQNFRDLQFTQKALVDGSGNGSATITAIGRNFVLDNSIFQGYNRGDLAGGDIAIKASSSILVQETSDIRTDVYGSGNGGSLLIAAPKITLYNKGSIVSVAWGGTGNAGNILIQGQEVTLTSDPIFLVDDASTKGSALVTIGKSFGNAGDITILADTLTFSNGAGFANITSGQGNSGNTTLISRIMSVRTSSGGATFTSKQGNGGDLNIITDSFYMDGSSGYATSSYGKESGRAGNINVTARSIIARDDGGFSSDTFGSSNAGNITFKADYIELDDAQLNSRTLGSGNAGTINLSAQTLRILNGGQLNVATKAAGNGGHIIIDANTVELNGEYMRGIIPTQNTGIISSVLPNSQKPDAQTGNGGNISVTASELLIRDGALISASTSSGQGNGGDILLQVDRLDAFNGGQIMSVTHNAGNAGNITVNARDRISLSGQDRLYIERQAAYIPEQDYSDVEYNLGPLSGIFANTTSLASGSGGNLKMTTGDLRIEDGAIVNVSSQGTGNAGNLSVNANIVRLNQQASLQADSVTGTQGNLFFNVERALLLRQGSTITTNATGTANGGNISINAPIILGLENSDIIANSVQGRGGNINITTQGIIGLSFRNTLIPRTDPTNDITASSQFNVNGTVDINNFGIDLNSGLVEFPENLSDPSQQIASGCSHTNSSSFVATGRGGIPQNPTQEINSEGTWSDIRDISAFVHTSPVTAQIPESTEVIVQATGWRRNAQGKIEIFADKSPTVMQPSLTCAAVPY